MTEMEAYVLVERAFEAALVQGFEVGDRSVDDLRAAGEVPLTSFDIDSLAVMEICIAVEVHSGAQIVPAELVELETINALVMRLLESDDA